MSCNCINRQAPNGRRRRGTAEVELLLVLPVLLTILLLCGIAVKLGQARLANAREAEDQAYRQVVRGEHLALVEDLEPVDTIQAVRPGLPVRFHGTRRSSTPALGSGWVQLNAVTLVDKAALLDPTLHLANWPMELVTATDQSQDGRELERWFVEFVEESHTWEVRHALGLAEPWRP